MEISELRKEAQEKMGLSDAQADAFVEGFLKEASFNFLNYEVKPSGKDSGLTLGQSMAGSLGNSVANAVGGGLGSLAVNSLVSGVAGIVSSARSAVLYRQFTDALKLVMESNRLIRNADRNKVVSYADTIYKFAPHVASDANLLSQLLANAIHGEGVDPSTIETITRLEERYSKDTGFKPKNLT